MRGFILKLIKSLLFFTFIVFPVFCFASGSVEEFTLEDLEKLIEEGKDYLLIDVRTEEEYNSGFIPTAINIPYDVIAENLPTEDKSALIILYCRSGRRSGIAKETLEGLGFTNVINFGAVENWKKELDYP
jgi:phage shock protein E